MAARHCQLGPSGSPIEERTRGSPIWPSTRRGASDSLPRALEERPEVERSANVPDSDPARALRTAAPGACGVRLLSRWDEDRLCVFHFRPHGQLQAWEDDPSAAGAGDARGRGGWNVLL